MRTLAMITALLLSAASQAQDICDRTPEVRDAILKALNRADCSTVASAGARLAGIKTLNLSGEGLTSLRAGDFEGLTRLQSLYLFGNRLTTLPDGVFDGLDRLQSLSLDGNQLTTLPAGVFDGLDRLYQLYLYGNRLTSLPEGVFDDLTRLHTLALHTNRLTELPDGVFDRLTRLLRLELHTNHLVGLTRDDPVFAAFSIEVDIELHDQLAVDGQTANVCDRTPEVRQAIMDEGVGDDCASVELAYIRSLGVAEKGLTSLRAGDFEGMSNLQDLVLSGERKETRLPERRYVSVFEWWDGGLTSLPVGVFDGLDRLQSLGLGGNQLTTLPVGVFDGLDSLEGLYLNDNQLTTLPAGVFDGLDSLERLALHGNRLVGLTRDDPVFAAFSSDVDIALDSQKVDICDRTEQVRDEIMGRNWNVCSDVNADRLAGMWSLDLSCRHCIRRDGGPDAPLTELRAGDFAGLANLYQLILSGNQLTTLPTGLFDGLDNVDVLWLDLSQNQLTTLPEGVFNGINRLSLTLHENQLTTLPEGLFDGVDLLSLSLHGNQLTTLPEGLFDGLANLGRLRLDGNELTSLPDGVFDGLDSLEGLYLDGNQLTSLPEDVFEGLGSLKELYLSGNQLTTLPAGVFDGLDSLERLALHGNRLVGLTRDDPVFAAFSSDVDIQLYDQTAVDGQTVAPRTNAAVPLMLSASTSGRQGFVRIVNEGDESGSVRVFAVDDGGYAPDPFELQLGAGQAVQFNSNDLENGNANKGIEGVGNPVEGDWRLDVATTLPVRVLSFVRHADGFLTAMHDVLPRTDDGRLAAHIFNPGRNLNQASRLRLVNTGADDADVSIEGVDDGGNTAGPVTLTLEAGESRTFSAVELESGARGLSGTLGAGAGKWRLFIEAGSSVVGMSLLESANGNLTNISTSGVAAGD